MKRYLKYIIMGIVAVTLYTLFFPGKDKEKGKPRDYQTIVESGILRAVTEYNSISYFADGDTVSGFHYELLNAFARSKGLTPEIILNKQVLVQRKPELENDSMYIHSQLELARKTLHVVKGSPVLLRIHNLSNEIGDTIYIQEVEKYGPEQLLAMVAHGDIDYTVCDESIAQASINDFPQLDIKTAISFTQFYSWGVSKHSPILLDSLNAWLDTYTLTPEFRELQKKYYNK